jgi:hypothetical protein
MSLGKTAAILLVLGLSAGCNTRGHVEPATASLSDESGYVLIGMRPEYMDVAIYTGDISDGTFSYSYPATFSGPPEDGFILLKAPAGSSVAVTTAVVRAWVHGMGAYDPRCPAVFHVEGGKVAYATTIVFDHDNGLVEHRVQEFDKAREFMNRHYPNLAGSLVHGSFKPMPLHKGGCDRPAISPGGDTGPAQ